MPQREWSSTAYNFGMGGQLKDDEIYGAGNSYSAEYWQYDPRLGRRWNVDPLTGNYPWQSPYVAFNDNPLFFTDPSGLEGEGGGDETYNDPSGKPIRSSSAIKVTGVVQPSRTYKLEESGTVAQAQPGSVYSFEHNGENYTARFNSQTGEFTRFANAKGETYVDYIPIPLEAELPQENNSSASSFGPDYYWNKGNREFQEDPWEMAWLSSYLSAITGATPDIANSGRLEMPGQISVGVSVVPFIGVSGSINLGWNTENNFMLSMSYSTSQTGLDVGVTGGATFYSPNQNWSGLNSMLGSERSAYMGLGPFYGGTSQNINSTGSGSGDAYQGYIFGISGGLFPVSGSTGTVTTIPLIR